MKASGPDGRVHTCRNWPGIFADFVPISADAVPVEVIGPAGEPGAIAAIAPLHASQRDPAAMDAPDPRGLLACQPQVMGGDDPAAEAGRPIQVAKDAPSGLTAPRPASPRRSAVFQRR